MRRSVLETRISVNMFFPHMTVRILALSNIHGKRAGLEYALKKVNALEPDLVVISEDASSGNDITNVFAILSGLDTPVLYVQGNMDPEALAEKATDGCGNCHNINGTRKEISGCGVRRYRRADVRIFGRGIRPYSDIVYGGCTGITFPALWIQ